MEKNYILIFSLQVYYFDSVIQLLITLAKSNADHSHNHLRNFLLLEDIFKILKYLFNRETQSSKSFLLYKTILSYYSELYTNYSKDNNYNKQRLQNKISTLLWDQLTKLVQQQSKSPRQEQIFYTFREFKQES